MAPTVKKSSAKKVSKVGGAIRNIASGIKSGAQRAAQGNFSSLKKNVSSAIKTVSGLSSRSVAGAAGSMPNVSLTQTYTPANAKIGNIPGVKFVSNTPFSTKDVKQQSPLKVSSNMPGVSWQSNAPGKTPTKAGSSNSLRVSNNMPGVSWVDSSGNIQSTSQSSFRESSGSTGSALASATPNTPSTNVINTPNLGTDAMNTKITFPEPVAQDYSQYTPAPVETPQPDATKERNTALQDLIDSMSEVPSSADAYQKAQRETGILQKQEEVNTLTGTLNGIVARGQAQQLSLVGQGRGIPEAIIGGQQAQIGRETAIAALPVQAQLSAAQGNLEMANDNLNTLFKIYSEDARNEFEAKREQKRLVYDIATEKEKRALDKLDKLEERAYQETKDLNDERLMYSKMAFANGQSSLGAQIAKLDYKSPNFRRDLAQLQSQLKDPTLALDIAVKQAQLIELNNKNSGTTINPKILSTSQFKAAQAAQNLKLTLEKAKAAVAKYGNYESMNPEGVGVLNSLKVQLRSEISTALEQGVVVPGEAAAFDQIAGQLNSSFLGVPNVRNSVTIAGLNSLSSSMDGRIALQKAALANTYGVAPEDLDTLLNITDLSDQEFADMDALIN